jgi:putative hemolysin
VPAITFELLIIVLLVIVNGLFSMSEIAVVTARRVRLARQAERGHAGARAAPVVWFLTASTHLVLRAFGVRGVPEPGLTEDEIHALVEQGAEAGVVPEVEHEIVESVFRLGDRTVASIMIPRPDVPWVDLHATAADVHEQLAQRRREWLLVCDGDIEEVRGVAHTADLLNRCLSGEPFDLTSSLSEPLYVPVMAPVFKLLASFRTSRLGVAVVLDEYGGVEGLATIDDLVAGLVGATAAGTQEQPMLSRQADGTWIASGAASVDAVEEALDCPPIEVNARRGFRTLSGFILAQLGRVPKAGDVIVWHGYRLTVEAMEGRRVERVRIALAHA